MATPTQRTDHLALIFESGKISTSEGLTLLNSLDKMYSHCYWFSCRFVVGAADYRCRLAATSL